VQEGSEGLDLKQTLGILRRRGWLIALCVLVVAGAAFGFSKQQTKKYTATAAVAFNNNSRSQRIAGLSANNLTGGELLAQEATNVELVKGGDIAAKTATSLGHGLNEATVSGSLSIAGQEETGIVVVSATTVSPTLSTEIANTYIHKFVKEQRKANLQFYKSALAIVNEQFTELSPEQRAGAAGEAVLNRAQTLSFLLKLKEGNAVVAAEARVPTSPSSPKTKKNTALGVVLGLLVGLGLALGLERLDRRIKGPEDLEEIYRLPLLGTVPKSAALSRSAREKGGGRAILPPAEAEAFSLIRAHLRFFNIDRDLRTVLIASAAPGDGKTTIARHLAEAATRLGSRVLLLEMDLRHPTLAQQLGIQSGPGLADTLIGAIPMDEATQPVELEAPSDRGAKGRTLDVMVAGTVLPPNPAELLESEAMDAVLQRAKSEYDFVVIDTPPLTAVSDAFPLLTKVDGVVIVGWVARSRRDAAERLHQVLASSGAPLLGVIANGAKSGGPGSYDYAIARDGKSSPGVASANGSSSEEFVPTTND
jgi:succinoglycan biosynthesis transport protein ExoP